MTSIWFAIGSGWSAQLFYDAYAGSVFNIIFTSVNKHQSDGRGHGGDWHIGCGAQNQPFCPLPSSLDPLH